jgi:hypothetical protein
MDTSKHYKNTIYNIIAPKYQGKLGAVWGAGVKNLAQLLNFNQLLKIS